MENNELWRLETGWLAGYTADKSLQRRIKRYKSWAVMAVYTDSHTGKPAGVQYRIPILERRPAERMFSVKIE